MNIRKIILEEVNDFEWVDDIPSSKTIGEIKYLDSGFRGFFNLGDTLIIDNGEIPCESSRNEGCFINLTDSEYYITNVYRTRIEIRPLNPETVDIFMDEWKEDNG